MASPDSCNFIDIWRDNRLDSRFSDCSFYIHHILMADHE